MAAIESDPDACPFRAFPGGVPQLWVGREQAQATLQSTYEGSGSLVGRCDLLIGSTGLGKSALLAWMSERAEGDGRPVVRITATGEATTAAGLGKAINDKIGSVRSGRSLLHKAGRAARRIPIRPTTPWTEYVGRAEDSGSTVLAKALSQLDALAREMDAPALLAIDEVHALDSHSAEALVNALVADNESVVQVVAAGLSSSFQRLVVGPMMSVAPRMFRAIELDLLTSDDSRVLLRGTAALGGVQWPDETIEAAALASGGSPSELQVIGERLWALSPFSTEAAHAELASYVAEREAQLARTISWLPREAVVLLSVVAKGGGQGMHLLELRATAKDDEEFARALDVLERTSLALVSSSQRVSLATSVDAVSEVLASASSSPQLNSGSQTDRRAIGDNPADA